MCTHRCAHTHSQKCTHTCAHTHTHSCSLTHVHIHTHPAYHKLLLAQATRKDIQLTLRPKPTLSPNRKHLCHQTPKLAVLICIKQLILTYILFAIHCLYYNVGFSAENINFLINVFRNGYKVCSGISDNRDFDLICNIFWTPLLTLLYHYFVTPWRN